MRYQFLLLILFFAMVKCTERHALSLRLRKWHVLKQDDIRLHRQKRSLNDDVVVPLDKQGIVMDDPNSFVTAHYDGKMLTASIQTMNETYVIEPMWRHASQKQGSSSESDGTNEEMLIYRESDVNLLDYANLHSSRGYCLTDELMKSVREKQKQASNKDHQKHYANNSAKHRRTKRSTEKLKKICKLSLVADYRFVKHMGNGSYVETMYYLISLIERVNRIYKTTNWGADGYVGFGFRINRIKIHMSESKPDDIPRCRYNEDKNWLPLDLLEAFSETNHSSCLSHLFTYIDFPNGTLGLAYVASQKGFQSGGICTYTIANKTGKTLYYNSGLTSTINWNRKILTKEADLVTAHELGHNFGAVHDDETHSNETYCIPGQARGGNYIMYPRAVSGDYPNNNKFSDCSKHAILPTLIEKADICFEEESESFCGNYKIDGNETCDVGLLTTNDNCCVASECTLKRGAKCSYKNSPCCTDDCQVADTTKLCRARVPRLCFKDTYCNGFDQDCPKEEPVADGMPCGDMGKCKNGKCEHFCTTKGLQPCFCTETELQCDRCCADANLTEQGTLANCKPYKDANGEGGHKLPENATCAFGNCNKKGECQKHTQDVIERVWDIFQYIAPDNIGEFLADNIVGAVLVFSLLFWIPCSCLINFVDKKRLKARENYSERAEFSRSFGTLREGVGGGSAPVTPWLRIPQNNAILFGGGIASNSGFSAREWRSSQERGMALKRSEENLNDRIEPRSPNDCNALSRSQPSLPHLSVNGNSYRPVVLSGAHPSLVSPMPSSLSEKSFDGDIKPIAVSSNANIPALNDSDIVVFPDKDAVHYRRNFKK